jgi:hypothetical protein
MKLRLRIARNTGLVIFSALAFVLCIKLVVDMAYRHEVINGRSYVARHIYLPGMSRAYELEQHISMKEWVGTIHSAVDLKAFDVDTDKLQPEASAGLALLSSGAFPGYSLKKQTDGHWELYKPGREIKYFSWSTPYRVSRWYLATDM